MESKSPQINFSFRRRRKKNRHRIGDGDHGKLPRKTCNHSGVDIYFISIFMSNTVVL